MDIGTEQEEYEIVEAPDETEREHTLPAPAPSKPVEAPVPA